MDKCVRDFLASEFCSSARARHEIAALARTWPRPPARKVKTIAFFYHRFFCGGIERVMAEQFRYFLELGYKIVLITEELPTERDFPLADGVVREFVSVDPVQRIDDLTRIFKQHGVNLYYTHAAIAKQTLWDLLIVRHLLGIRIVVHAHGIFPCSLVWGEDDLQDRLDTYRLADELIVLSRADAFYYQAYGIPAMYIPNPITEIPRQEGLMKQRFASKLVLSVGRVCSVKRTLDVLITAEKVRRLDPSIKFLIVGSREDVNYWKRMQQYYRKAGLGDTVNFQDYTLDVASLYRQGSVLLVTSQLEGFPMVMAEAKGYGLPVVSYDLPYVEFMREPDSGILTAPHGDCDALARQILLLLNDTELYRQQSAASRVSYERIPSGTALCDMYRVVIERVSSDQISGTAVENEDARAAFEALVGQMRVCFKDRFGHGWRAGSESERRRCGVPQPPNGVLKRARSLVKKTMLVIEAQGFRAALGKAHRKIAKKVSRHQRGGN